MSDNDEICKIEIFVTNSDAMVFKKVTLWTKSGGGNMKSISHFRGKKSLKISSHLPLSLQEKYSP
jgi:hypothetical protein